MVTIINQNHFSSYQVIDQPINQLIESDTTIAQVIHSKIGNKRNKRI